MSTLKSMKKDFYWKTKMSSSNGSERTGAQILKCHFSDIEHGGWTERIKEHQIWPHEQGPPSFEMEYQVSLRPSFTQISLLDDKFIFCPYVCILKDNWSSLPTSFKNYLKKFLFLFKAETKKATESNNVKIFKFKLIALDNTCQYKLMPKNLQGKCPWSFTFIFKYPFLIMLNVKWCHSSDAKAHFLEVSTVRAKF